MKRAVFLDRDGVINAMVYNPDYGVVDSPANPDEFQLLPGVAQAIEAVRSLGFLVIVVSNQPGIAKGKYTPALLEAMNNKLTHLLAEQGAALDGRYYCLHHPKAVLPEYRRVCDCRKPSPGLIVRAAQEWGIDLETSYMLGDGITDVAAGEAAGVITLFISPRKCYICDEFSRQEVQPDYVVKDLNEGVDVIRQLEGGGSFDLSRYTPVIVQK